MNKRLPVILLTFANEQDERATYLRNIPRELNVLRAILEEAEEAGLCELVILSNTTLDQIFHAFQKPRYRGRISIFHFGGHAESFQLLLETNEKRKGVAHSKGLVPFLTDQQNLKLIFFNGCYSIRQTQALLDGGIPAVVGTVQAIDDDMATRLAERFYRALAYGKSIDRAWREAIYYLQAGEERQEANAYYRTNATGKAGLRGQGLQDYPGRFPWEIHYRPGAEAIRNWNLPEAADNLLFGLPVLPDSCLLPNEPFHFLKRYTRNEARVFFGRSREIRGLYERISNKLSSPVVLLHGQSGVGKSSLLEAGLLPRLESQFQCIYLRRIPEKGLSTQLEEALGFESITKTSEKERQSACRQLEADILQLEGILDHLEGDAQQQVKENISNYRERLAVLQKGLSMPSLQACWKAKEKELPLLLIIDQVEEVFNRPNPRLPNELNDFLLQLQSLFGIPEERPRGKVLLSYRQEYHPLIDKAMSDLNIYREEAPIFRLDKKGLMEVVSGLNSTQALRHKYNLTIDQELPLMIADDLLEDKHSPIAPVLQIILTKMWQKQQAYPVKEFRPEDYLHLKKEGILLQDFFDQQMAALRSWEREIQTAVESSGLVLDILNFHVTAMSTANTQDLEKLRALYDHRADILDRLIEKFQELYLLTGLSEDKVRLAHDTLGPIVRKKMSVSDYPGQRALRILEAKTSDFILAPQATYIDEVDLDVVEAGAYGMRQWFPQEKELIEKSRKRRAALRAERKRNQRFRMGAVLAIALLAMVATLFWRMAEQGKIQAESDARYNEGKLLAVDDPTKGLAMIEQALQLSPADQTKRQALASFYNDHIFYDTLFRDTMAHLNRAVVSPDGRYLATVVDKDHEIRIFNLFDNLDQHRLHGPNSPVYSMYFTADQRLLAGSEDRNAYSWHLPTASRVAFKTENGSIAASIRSLCSSANGQWILTGHAANFARLWDAVSGHMLQEFATSGEVETVIFHPNGKQVFLGIANGDIYCYSTDGLLLQHLEGSGLATISLALSPDGTTLLSGHEQGEVRRWQKSEGGYKFSESIEAHRSAVSALFFSSRGQYWFSASHDQTAKVWEAGVDKLLYTLLGHTGPLHSLSILEDNSAIFTAAEDSTILRWSFPHPLPWKQLEASGFRLNDIIWTPDERYLMAASIDRNIYIWETENFQQVGVYEEHQGSISCLAVSPDGQWVASGDDKGEVHIWELAGGTQIKRVRLHDEQVNGLEFAPSGDRSILASAGNDRKAVIWNWQAEDLDTTQLVGHHLEVSTLAFSVDGNHLLTGGMDSMAILWARETWQSVISFQLEAEPLAAQSKSRGNEWMILCADDRIVQLMKGAAKEHQPGHADFHWSDSKQFYLSWDVTNCRPALFTREGFLIQSFYLPSTLSGCSMNKLSMSPSGQWLCATREGKILIWNNQRLLENIPPPLDPSKNMF